MLCKLIFKNHLPTKYIYMIMLEFYSICNDDIFFILPHCLLLLLLLFVERIYSLLGNVF